MNLLSEGITIRNATIGVLLATTAVATSAAMFNASKVPWFAPGRANRTVSPLTGSASDISLGKQVFLQQCASCHGNTGRGNGEAGKALDTKPGDLTRSYNWVDTDGTLFWKITRGRAPMTSFEELLTDSERWSVVSFIRTLSEEPSHVSAPQSLDPDASAALAGVLKEYDRLVISWITGNPDFIKGQIDKLKGKLDAMVTLGSTQAASETAERLQGLTRSMSDSLLAIASSPNESTNALEGFATLSKALVEIVETFGHSQKRPIAILQAGDRAWLQLNGPAWSPFGDERESIVVRHFIDPL